MQWWRPAHQYNGRILLLLGLANTFIAIYVAQEDYSWYVWVCIVWVIILCLEVGKAINNRRKAGPQATPVPGSSTPAKAIAAKANTMTANSIEMA